MKKKTIVTIAIKMKTQQN